MLFRSVHRNRLIGLGIAVAALAPLLVAANLAPASAGLGTHEQLGLPKCGFLLATGTPCMTCGMTTAFAHATHGHLLDALLTQPAGLMICVLCAAFALIGGWAAYSGMSLRPLGAALGRRRVLLTGLAVMVLAWGYNIWVHMR